MAMKTAKKYNPDLILHGNLIRAILSLAIPVVINSFLQTMYNLTDTYWLGKIGTEQLAAINLVTPMQNIITNFGSGITVAGAVLIAQYIGAGEKEDARSMANQIFACAMGFAVVCATLCFLGTPAIINWLGADGGTAYYARVICGWSSGICPFYIWSTFFPQYIRHREIRCAPCSLIWEVLR